MWFIKLYNKVNQGLEFEFDDSKDQLKIIQVYIATVVIVFIIINI